MSNDPRRRQPRRAVPGRVEVFDVILEEPVGYLGNLSAGGMLMMANRSLPDDALFQFRFHLPDGIGAAQPLKSASAIPVKKIHHLIALARCLVRSVVFNLVFGGTMLLCSSARPLLGLRHPIP